MDIQTISEINKKMSEIEQMVLEIDASIFKISPNLKSTILFKKNMTTILDCINVAKDDISNFRNGKELRTEGDVLRDIFSMMKDTKQGGPDGLPPNGFGLGPDGPFGL